MLHDFWNKSFQNIVKFRIFVQNHNTVIRQRGIRICVTFSRRWKFFYPSSQHIRSIHTPQFRGYYLNIRIHRFNLPPYPLHIKRAKEECYQILPKACPAAYSQSQPTDCAAAFRSIFPEGRNLICNVRFYIVLVQNRLAKLVLYALKRKSVFQVDKWTFIFL